jgi:hypothetical protein
MNRCQAENKADKPVLNDKAGSPSSYTRNQWLKPNPLEIGTRQLNASHQLSPVCAMDLFQLIKAFLKDLVSTENCLLHASTENITIMFICSVASVRVCARRRQHILIGCTPLHSFFFPKHLSTPYRAGALESSLSTQWSSNFFQGLGSNTSSSKR